MADDIPFRTRIKSALSDALTEITPAAGYLSDLAPFDFGDGSMMARVYRGRAFFGDDDPLPMVAILERPDEADEVSDPPIQAKKQQYNLHLVVQGFVPDNKDNPTDEADKLLADVKRRLAIERDRKDSDTGRLPDPLGLGGRRQPNRVEEMSFGAGIVRPADEISAKAYFWLGVALRVIEDPLFPFA